MGKGFHKVNLCLVGKFEYTAEKVKQWVENNGGKFSKTVAVDVTHLITSKEAFRKSPTVREARRNKGIKIVSMDWLEDSLWSEPRRPKHEGPYLWDHILETGRKKAPQKKGTQKKKIPTRGRRAARCEPEGPDGYHIYTDKSSLKYRAVLVRPSAATKSKEKHIISIYEYDANPPAYATFVKYTRVGAAGSDFLAARGSTWEDAFFAFTQFFRSKCGKSWDQRKSGTKPAPMKDRNGNILPENEGWFHYEFHNAG